MFIDQKVFEDTTECKVTAGELRRIQYVLGTGTFMPVMFESFNKSLLSIADCLGGLNETDAADRADDNGEEG